MENTTKETYHVQNLRQTKMTSSLFSTTVFAYWDNVMGPLIKKIWHGNDNVDTNEEIINYVSNHTLSGELCRQTDKHTVDPKLCILPSYIFIAFIFNKSSKMGPTITSLSFIMARNDLERYLLLQDYIEKQVKLIILRYKVYEQKDAVIATTKMERYLTQMFKTIDTLQYLAVPDHICVSQTIFGESEVAHSSKLLDSKFLMRALTSHLQTHGSTIVTGTKSEHINLLISTLSLFQTKEERYCSRLAAEEEHMFRQDLWVQGLVYTDDPLKKIECNQVILNTYPVTLIDVDETTVKQLVFARNHFMKRRINLEKEATSILLYCSELIPAPVLKEMFTEEFGDIAEMVQKFISQLFSIPNNCNIRRNHIENFKQMLYCKASAMLSYVEARSRSGFRELEHREVVDMKQDLCLYTESDFRIVLAAAEKLRPGLTSFLVKAIEKINMEFQAMLEAI